MTINKTTLSIALGSVFVASLAAPAAVSAAQNPFTMASLEQGYMVAAADMATDAKMKDGKCGEGKCGAAKDATKTKEKAKAKDSKSDDKAKMKEAKCGEGKCGATMK